MTTKTNLPWKVKHSTILSYIIQKASVYHTVNGDHVLLQTYCIT